MMAAWLHQVAGLRVPAPRIERGRRPLWAYVWPAGLVLAELVAGEFAAQIAGRTVLELGCGLGAVGLSAAKVGGIVTLTDREPEALELAQNIAAENSLAIETCLLEWSRVPEALVGRFDVVLGADIMYDPAQLTPMLGALHTLLAPTGHAWISDADRVDPSAFETSAQRAGLTVQRWCTVVEPPVVPTSDDSHRQPVHIYRLHKEATAGDRESPNDPDPR
jgi:2-polyprenyl-3-methyl-5-hydroxy-6-metoxy-1,4-benzoquinol methylase